VVFATAFLFPMNNLYTIHPDIYEMMYQTFINYDEEFSYYSDKIKKYNAGSVIELGCGTGSLAKRFIANGFDYTGLDLNKTMLDLAAGKSPGVKFIEADMRNFELQGKKQACIIAGRSISYLMTNEDVMDNIDAAKFIPLIKNGKGVIHKAEFDGRRFHRESYWSVNGEQTWTFNWDSVYSEENEKGELKKIAEDNSTVRCFTKDDLCLFLELCNFSVKEIEDRPSYAFDTFVVVAQKNN
jgi:SAM-dependent methyltransferase